MAAKAVPRLTIAASDPLASAHGQPATFLASWLIRNLRLDQFNQEGKRLLPAKIARLGRNGIGNPLLRDVYLGPTEHLRKGDGHMHHAWQIRIVEHVGVANSFVWHQFEILPAEGVDLARCEVRERHHVGATDASVHVVNVPGGIDVDIRNDLQDAYVATGR